MAPATVAEFLAPAVPPLPLGGTSNHFDTRLLRLVGAWDPRNVTEDADLGLRAAVEGYRVGVIKSTTWVLPCTP